MVKKHYSWEDGVTLEDHSSKKLQILKDYFREYLITRCKLPYRRHFRLAIIDGFAGGGQYKCGSYGSPLTFIDTLNTTLEEINIDRIAQGIQPIEIECYIILNDIDKKVISILKENIAPIEAKIKETSPRLHISINYYSLEFHELYSYIKEPLRLAGYKNVIFNLDQYGYSDVYYNEIQDIMSSWKSAEIFLTFSIETALCYLSPNKSQNQALIKQPEMYKAVFNILEKGEPISKGEWQGKSEKVIFDLLSNITPYFSPFSIHNPNGWRYWLIHFANSYRARQVYNNILHDNSTMQAHYGRAGLNMLSYNPEEEGQLYLFDVNSRETAKKELYDDIPRLLTGYGDALTMEDFYASAYSSTPAHSDDIHTMIMENDDLSVITKSGGVRRKANQIKKDDILKFKKQISMFPFFNKF